jgi:hypothetical protein
MCEAKRKRAAQGAADPMVYHHTSILVTNRIWMDGVLSRIRKMVTLCQQGRVNGQRAYIPPAWMDFGSPEKQGVLSRKLGVPVVEA